MNTPTTRHEFITHPATLVDGLERNCPACGQPAWHRMHSDPADDLPGALVAAAQDAVDVLANLAHELQRAGGRSSANVLVRRFCAYHLADLEGNDGGAEWLADNLLADALRALVQGKEA